MKFKKQIVKRTIAGQPLLIPVGDMTGEYNGVFTLTDTGELIIDSIQAGLEEEDIVKAMLEKFEIDEESARADVGEFLNSLREYGLID